MNKYLLAVILGAAAWLIGYMVGIPLLAAQEYMHTAESVIGALVGMLFAAWYFFRLKLPAHPKTSGPDGEGVCSYATEGLKLGLIWLALMWVLDYLFLLPLMGGDLAAWFASIGLGYMGIPITITIFGWALDKKKG